MKTRLVIAASCLTACYMPEPVAHARLAVSATGTYTFDGQSVSPEMLARALAARQAATPTLLVEIQVSPHSSVDAVHQAVQTVRLAHARLAFAKTASAP